jgi:hypothetical protein
MCYSDKPDLRMSYSDKPEVTGPRSWSPLIGPRVNGETNTSIRLKGNSLKIQIRLEMEKKQRATSLLILDFCDLQRIPEELFQ